MRDIKFRVWDEASESFFYIDFAISKINKYVGSAGITDSKNKNRCIDTQTLNSGKLEQFTGLKDKNGKEIYECDIIEHPSGETGVIVYEQHGCQFRVKYENYYSGAIGLQIGEKGLAVVVGNIHETRSNHEN